MSIKNEQKSKTFVEFYDIVRCTGITFMLTQILVKYLKLCCMSVCRSRSLSHSKNELLRSFLTVAPPDDFPSLGSLGRSQRA